MNPIGEVCARNDSAKAVLAAVQRRIGPQKFNAWFRNGTRLTCEDGDVKVGVANTFVAGWVETHFIEDLAAAAEEVTGRRGRVLVTVDPALSGRLRKRQLDIQARLVAQGTAGTARKPRPAPQPLRHRLEDFVVGPSNRLAHSAAAAVASTGKAGVTEQIERLRPWLAERAEVVAVVDGQIGEGDAAVAAARAASKRPRPIRIVARA